MSDQPARGQFGIGEVLGQLRPEFPDISASKIRFLEDKGLIARPGRDRATAGSRRPTSSGCATSSPCSGIPTSRWQVIRERLADGAADGAAAPGGPGSLGALSAVGRDGPAGYRPTCPGASCWRRRESMTRS